MSLYEAKALIDWNTLIRAHGSAVFGIAWRILGHAEDAEDVVQEVFAEAHRQSNGMEVECWAALLCRMATCRALDALRRRRIAMPLEADQIIAAKDVPEEKLAARELEARLRSAIKELPHRDAEVFCLRYFENLSHRQIAETLEISATAASTALSRARSRLEILLGVPKKESRHE
ncbi:MAG: sigma-70 family RNA polymerase sigma factor [Thermoguttaceae bacterium]|jgi:RNA polymerase sigma-70 factor (ECF subfamily)